MLQLVQPQGPGCVKVQPGGRQLTSVSSPTRRRLVCLPCLQDAAREEADVAVKEALDAQEKPDVEHEVAAAVEKALDEERARVAEVSHCIQELFGRQRWAAV